MLVLVLVLADPEVLLLALTVLDTLLDAVPVPVAAAADADAVAVAEAAADSDA